jgi:hypothetical protein
MNVEKDSRADRKAMNKRWGELDFRFGHERRQHGSAQSGADHRSGPGGTAEKMILLLN